MNDNPPAGLLRRLAAAFYDSLVVAALFMLATFAVIAFRGGEPVNAGNLPFQMVLVATAATYYVSFWVNGGQTVGMRTWRIKIERQSGEALHWKIGLLRFVAGIASMIPAGLGMLWMLVDRDSLTWYDRLAGTRVVVVPRAGKSVPGSA